jgi:sporulation protein YlmC with PRC-barrel domain
MLMEDDSTERTTAYVVSSQKTASGMIGKPVFNEAGEGIAKITDIIVDQNGKATMVIVTDGQFTKMGKKVAFDYDAVTRIDADGDFIMPVTEKIIDQARAFSYDRAEASKDTRVIAENSYSVAALLDGQLVDQNQKAVADIDNIVFKDGHATHLIVGFDKTLGMGGDKVALNYMSVPIIRASDEFDFQLSAKQTTQFEFYRENSQ